MKMGLTIAAIVILGGSLLVSTGVIGPKLVRDGYEGRSLGTVNAYFAATERRSRPMEFYLDKLNNLTQNCAFIVLSAVFITFFVQRESRNDWSMSRKVIGEATAESLGMIRLIVCAITFGFTFSWDVASVTLLPKDLASGPGGVIGLFRLLPGFMTLESSWTGLQVMKAIMLAALAMGTIGWWTRWALPVAAVTYTIFAGLLRVPSFYWHEGLVCLYLIYILCVTPCGDGLSIDRLLRVRRNGPASCPPSPSLNYGWGRFGCWMIMALVYFSSGFSKLRNGGLGWWEPNSLKCKIFEVGLDHMPAQFDFTDLINRVPIGLIAMMGISTLVFEMGMILTPFSRWARRIFPICCALLHIGITLAQNIVFIDLILLQSIFMEPERLLPWIGRRLNLHPIGAKDSAPAEAQIARPARVQPAKPTMVMSILIACVFVLTCMANKVEYYPISCFAMFSWPPNPTKTTVNYYKLLAHLDDGTTTRANPEHQIGAMWGCMYRAYFAEVWEPEVGPRRLDKFLQICGGIHNRSKDGHPRIVEYELQKWEWNWQADRDDPKHGHVIETHRTPIDH